MPAKARCRYRVNGNMTPEEFKADIKLKQSQGKKVMISLGGGGQRFTLETEADKQRFIKSVEAICSEFGFDGIDIDFETPSLELNPGDTDPKHPTTASTVNLIAAMREIHDHFGPRFMLSLVPEGSQTPAGYPGYGGQFGSYLPLLEGIRDILAFTDTQDYNCPPIQGLDGEYLSAWIGGLPRCGDGAVPPGLRRGTRSQAPLRCPAAREGDRRISEQRYHAADRGGVDANADYRTVEPSDNLQDAEAGGLSHVLRSDVLDHRRGSARGVPILERSRAAAARPAAEMTRRSRALH